MNVLFRGSVVGDLRTHGTQGFEFEYAQEWIGSSQAFPISLSMPLVTCSNKALSEKLLMMFPAPCSKGCVQHVLRSEPKNRSRKVGKGFSI